MKAQCDCCGKIATLCRVEASGIETYACAECHGYAADEFDEDQRMTFYALFMVLSLNRQTAVAVTAQFESEQLCIEAGEKLKRSFNADAYECVQSTLAR